MNLEERAKQLSETIKEQPPTKDNSEQTSQPLAITTEPITSKPVLKNLSADIEQQYEKNKTELAKQEDYQKITKEITERATKAQLSSDMLAIMTEEQKQALAMYALECEKKKLDYRQKAEKKLILEEVKADVQNRKIENLKKRYGYLYQKDEAFVPNKIHNRARELANWWNGTSNNFKKFVKGTLKMLFWGAIAALIVVVGYEIFQWITHNVQNLPQVTE